FIEHGLVAPAHVISNGVDTTRYHPGPPASDVVSRYALPEGRRVLAVGRLAKDKDLDVLIRSMAHLHTTPPTHLLVVGEGPHRNALVACAQEQRVSDRVHFLDFVPEDDLPDIYRASDVFAISSNHEVQSIPALQAAATGLPIVAVTSGSLPEICRDGDNGILVPPGDEPALAAALMTVLDPEVRDRMGRASERLARLHDENATFDSYESLYHKTAVRTLVRVRTREAFGTGRFQ
ncbi:MAG: glycosyltransferase, partial [Coriobacteriales bacterium]